MCNPLDERPHVTFNFFYRSLGESCNFEALATNTEKPVLDYLQAEGIAPLLRAPQVTPRDNHQVFQSMTAKKRKRRGSSQGRLRSVAVKEEANTTRAALHENTDDRIKRLEVSFICGRYLFPDTYHSFTFTG